MNKLWSILSGAPATPIFGDWRRLTETSGLNISSESLSKIKTVLGDTDPFLRGFMVEGVLQAALLSNYKDALLKYDPINTYDIPITKYHDNILLDKDGNKLPSSKAYVTQLADLPRYYNIKGTVSWVDATNKNINVNVNGIDHTVTGNLVSPTQAILFDNIAINTTSQSIFDGMSFDIYTLPKLSALSIFFKRMLRNFPNETVNKDAITCAGAFTYGLIND